MSNALPKNNVCDSNELDGQKERVGDFVTDDSPKEKLIDKEQRPKHLPVRYYTAKHCLQVDFRKVQFDGRSSLARWMNKLKKDLTKDLGGDLSTMEKILLDRIVSKIVRCHLYETGILSGQEFGSQDHYMALSNSLRLDMNLIGLKKRAKNPLDLGEYLKRKAEPPEDH